MTEIRTTTRRLVLLLVPVALSLSALSAMVLALPASAQGKSDAPTPFALQAAASYRQAARYPASSHAIEAGHPDPVMDRYTPSRHSLGGPDGAMPRLSVWSGAVAFEAPEPVDLFARLEGPGKQAVAITGEVQDAAGRTIGEVTYLDDGVEPDAHAHDGVFSARFTLPEGQTPKLAQAYLVQVHATLDDGDFRTVAAGFLYTSPWARLTGEFRDGVKGGNLIVSAQVEVERAGRFHLEGTLHTMSGAPVGWAQAAVELEPGIHWVDLSFYGLMFHDRRVSGRLRLGAVALTTTGAMPNGLSRPMTDAYVTRPFKLQQMTSSSFGRQDLLRAADQLEKRGVPAAPSDR